MLTRRPEREGNDVEILAAVLFAAAALGGVFLAARHLGGQKLPGSVAVIHGAAAATALVLLAIAVLTNDLGSAAVVALVLFVVAALGGFYLVTFHLAGKRHPTPLVVGHGLIAVVAFLTLLVAII